MTVPKALDPRFLEGRVALVTGGASGMGRACALEFARAGAHVAIGSLLGSGVEAKGDGAIVNLPPSSEMDAVKADIESMGVRCHAGNLDVTDPESATRFVEAVRADLGPIDILLNAAGMTVEHTVRDHPEALWDKLIDVNLTGTFRMTRLCFPEMMDRGWGRVINIASTAATVGAPTSAAYCASKAGVVGFSKCVALEGAPHGVTCNTISPTWVSTTFGVKWMQEVSETNKSDAEAAVKEATALNPQGRALEAHEIAALALYLCQDRARAMTMQDLVLSAGSLW